MMTEASAEWRRKLLWRLTWATLVPIAVMIVAMVLKPLWRDEYWSLYFTEPRFSLGELFTGRMLWETHPPLYFIFLALWRTIADTDVWIRLLALPFLAVGVAGALILGRGLKHTWLFLLMCAGSYWVIYFATEARPYTLLFVLCAWSTLILARAFERPENAVSWSVGWALVCGAICVTHYFGGLWVACTGLAAGIAFLSQKRVGAFAAIGIASVLALAPVVTWLYFSYPHLGERGGNPPPGPEELSILTTQLTRGIFVKLLGSNLAITAACIAGFGALWRLRQPIDRVILGGALLFIAISSALDLLWSPMIKERAFTAMMPALILVMARAVFAIDPVRPWARRFITAIPIVAIISPFLFIPEYFKDREKLVEVRALMTQQAEACAGSPVVAFMRTRWSSDLYPRELIDRQIRQATPPGVEPIVIVSTEELDGTPPQPVAGCPIRAIAFTLRPGEREEHERAREALERAGLDLETLEERRFGKGRNIVWLNW
jgi:hypothetical protein